MRKLLFIILLLSSYSASAQIIKLRVNKIILLNDSDNPDERTVDYMATINKPKAKIKIYAKEEITYDLVQVIKQWNEEGQPHVRYKALDKSGEECVVETVDFGTNLNIAVTYPPQTFGVIYKMEYEQ